MLLEFTVENYRSFYRKKTLVLEADKALKECTETNLFDCNKYTLLRSLALYGANSSGKSNLVSAMHAMASCVLLSVKLNDNEQLEYDPFLLLKDNHHPSMFEIIFLKGEYCYRYGFRYNLERIVEEWLFRKTTPRSKEQMMFVRNEDGICVDENNFPEGVGYEEKTNDVGHPHGQYVGIAVQLPFDRVRPAARDYFVEIVFHRRMFFVVI